MMPEGSEWEIYVPENIGYGERAMGNIPPFSTLIFKMEIVKVEKDEPAKTEQETKAVRALSLFLLSSMWPRIAEQFFVFMFLCGPV